MQLGGKPIKVELLVDLTRYDSRCTIGSMGMTMPGQKIGLYGSFDHFVAVRFDSGACLDILWTSIKQHDVKKSKKKKGY